MLESKAHVCRFLYLLGTKQLTHTRDGNRLLAMRCSSTIQQQKAQNRETGLQLVDYINTAYLSRNLKTDWDEVSSRFGLLRSWCYHLYNHSIATHVRHAKSDSMFGWAADEISRLCAAKASEGSSSDWKTISGVVGTGRTASQCRTKWNLLVLDNDPRVLVRSVDGQDEHGPTTTGVSEGADNASGSELSYMQLLDRGTQNELHLLQRMSRYHPDIDELYNSILGWTYEEATCHPADINPSELQPVPLQFRDSDQYIRVFKPLVLLEYWERLRVSMRCAETFKYGEATVKSRTMQKGFVLISFITKRENVAYIKNSNLILFSESSAHNGTLENGRTQGAPPADKMMFGRRSSDSHTFVAMVKWWKFDDTNVTMTVRAYFPAARLDIMLKMLSPNTTWDMTTFFSTINVRRDYSSLVSLKGLDLGILKELLRPKENIRPQLVRNEEVQQAMKAYALDRSQAEAVVSAAKRETGFTLIEGGPGTGKTRTILGLAGALLSDPITGKGRSSASGRVAKNRLLICAHSNSSVDEIAKRLKSGIRDNYGKSFLPRVVRLGRPEPSNDSMIHDLILDYQLEKALESVNLAKAATVESIEPQSSLSDKPAESRSYGGGSNIALFEKQTVLIAIKSLQAQIDKVNEELEELSAQMLMVDVSDTATIDRLVYSSEKAKQRMGMLKGKRDKENENLFEIFQKIEKHPKTKMITRILEEADIICCPLSYADTVSLAKLNTPFDTVIIDDATQNPEFKCLKPLQHGCKRCILVGDMNQPNEPLYSQLAAERHFGRCLFTRLAKSAPQAMHVLSTQHRMHPEISSFPLHLFNESRLADNTAMAVKQSAPWHADKKYPPFGFINVTWKKEDIELWPHANSNAAECIAAVRLVYNLCTDYSHLPWKHRIGVIAPNIYQLGLAIHMFSGYFGESVKDVIKFDIARRFRGDERDVIIFLCVKAGEGNTELQQDMVNMSIGFTRARKSLFVLGNVKRLAANPLWRAFIDDTKKRGLLREESIPLLRRRVNWGRIPKSLLVDT